MTKIIVLKGGVGWPQVHKGGRKGKAMVKIGGNFVSDTTTSSVSMVWVVSQHDETFSYIFAYLLHNNMFCFCINGMGGVLRYSVVTQQNVQRHRLGLRL